MSTIEREYVTERVVAPAAMIAAARFLVDNWGEYGYRIGVQYTTHSGAIFGCRHSDGSEFFIHADKYGNAREVEWNGREWQDK